MVVRMCPWSSGTLPAEQFISPPSRCVVRIAAANEVPEAVPEAGAGQGIGGSPRKGGP